ncbi:zinc-dependent alcohol dehydrogenase [Pedosphaera parvula]|uniref:Alcohol dehydrogenase GroES domain protein n=1 Tax=Pedosphaera parvula (strain Ellin514) TaxID=320771 RepID=B9XPA3_PEDPL|nr:zinc-dependent alcohol dehydrogenase [Pedosphaera parvula]EEF58354.1 Alcohol dehydrogenase GroES domain protein [Pedosphaera parvula Ellin514]
MRAVCWYGKKDVRVEEVDDPRILNPGDAIIKVTSTTICGSDLHLFDGFIPSMEEGDILGHEFMGEVEEVGPNVKNLKPGDRVVVPFCISCGQCHHCQHQEWSLCDNTNPNAARNAKLNGFSGAGLFGYSHLYGGYAGGQAQYARVPFADVGPIKIPNGMEDEQVLFLSDIFPTGYMAAENCNIEGGDIVAVWGCGPVGQFAIRSAYLLGAEKVYAIDEVPERMKLAEEGGAIAISDKEDVIEILKERTGGRGPDACIDAVGMEAHGSAYDVVKQAIKLETDRPYVLRQAMRACRKGGTLSIPGVYAGFLDKIPLGAAFAKGLTFKMGQTHVHKYLRPLLQLIQDGKIDPRFVITHRIALSEAPDAYEMFAKKADGCIKIVMKPHEQPAPEIERLERELATESAEDFAMAVPRSKRLREEK